ncbi:hypothetical protein A7P92_06360 [Eikenella corrodens]|jgi:hypothetical protein|uniref:hypothetical protein n=1 Tax=Eikenella corrodens TaxID=539 RepID=UPI0007D0A4B2|nr:hypothetical protein [Eikenella corrodens]OAM23694.1 hypothetical protein A7P92_06360 [Eikenella corrodens]
MGKYNEAPKLTFDERLQALKKIKETVNNDDFYSEILQMQRDGLIKPPTFNLKYGHDTSDIQLSNYSLL